MTRVENCIYCADSVDLSRGQGDHIIPAALGEFRGDVHFRRICRRCNGLIGQSEAQLLRCGPERLFRQFVVPATSRSRGSASGWYVGAEGAPPPELCMDVPEHGMLLTRHRPELNAGEIIDQLIVDVAGGTRHHIRLFPEMSPVELKARYDALGVTGKVSIAYNCDESHHGVYMKLFAKSFGVDIPDAHSSIEPGMSQSAARFTFKVNSHYFRAVAKIVFHYYLVHTQRFRGDEECFDPIRRFIVEGGNEDEFFGVRRVFTDEVFGSGFTSSSWLHICASYESCDLVVGYVRLFHGPLGKGHPYHVLLGRPKSKIVLATPAWAHMYAYDSPVPDRGKVGEVRRLPLLTRRPRPSSCIAGGACRSSRDAILDCWRAWFGWLEFPHGEDSENRYLLEHDEAND